MKRCPNCDNIISPNSYFGKYLCSRCGYEEKVGDMTQNINKLDVINFLRENIHNFTEEEIINIKEIINEYLENLNVFKDDNVGVNDKAQKKEFGIHIPRCRKNQK